LRWSARSKVLSMSGAMVLVAALAGWVATMGSRLRAAPAGQTRVIRTDIQCLVAAIDTVLLQGQRQLPRMIGAVAPRVAVAMAVNCRSRVVTSSYILCFSPAASMALRLAAAFSCCCCCVDGISGVRATAQKTWRERLHG
jgi:hypothetical protein